MTSTSSNDPFDWSVEQLSQELCGEGRPWMPNNPQKRPESAALEAALKEHHIDGETLLTWGDVFETHDDLYRDLGITKAAHRMTIAKAIGYLKRRSPAYRQFKDKMETDQQSQMTDGGQDHVMSDGDLPPDQSADPDPPLDMGPARGAVSSNDMPTEKHLQKKRKVAPELVSTEVRFVGLAPLPTAADGLAFASSRGPEAFLTNSNHAYLGRGKLIVSDHVPRNTWVGSHELRSGDYTKELSWVTSSQRIPPGRQLQMKTGMHRLLKTNNAILEGIRENIAFMDPGPSEPSLEEDQILPVFGESDDEYDSDHLREMEEETSSIRPVINALTFEQAKAALDNIVQQYMDAWNDKKLDRLERKAQPLWRTALRNGRNEEIHRSIKRLAELKVRIDKLSAEILAQDWPTEAALRRQARCLEASIDDRQYLQWYSTLLKGREPPRAPTAPRRPRLKRPKAADLSDDDGDFITSDSDNGIDDLDENDLQPARAASPTFSVASLVASLPATEKAPGASGRMLKSPKNTRTEERVVIDLVSPNPPRFADLLKEKPASDFELTHTQLSIPFNRPQDIGAVTVEAWKHHQDAKRMTISFLWNDASEWRDELFKLIRTHEPNTLWDEMIRPACKAHSITLLTATQTNELHVPRMQKILARLFWQFAYCDVRTRITSEPLSQKSKDEILKKHEEFHQFIIFMRQQVISNFPRQGQATTSLPPRSTNKAVANDQDTEMTSEVASKGLYSDDTDEDATDDADDEVAGDAKHRKRGRRQKRIQRDKDAEEKQRNALRSRQLAIERQKAFASRMEKSRLDGYNTISEEDQRLIINGSQVGENDSGFIVVSKARWGDPENPMPSIADRIKDHQIEGVRFMWDHIVSDSGCLLAHTMGLGKTMQIITLLVALREAATSKDARVREQIPEQLRGEHPKFLILCPSGLCENWTEEFKRWAPPDVFGASVRVITSELSESARLFEVRQWASIGGVLIIGYPMFRQLYFGGNQEIAKAVTEDADIVIADEAHTLKNPNSQVYEAGSKIKTPRRLALTASPLANNIGEFYATLDWISPNYLGPWKEFHQFTVKPIETGLWADCTPGQYRQAKKKLAALERTVGPRTHRLTANCLKEQLPGKIEFIVTVPMLPLQTQLYDMYTNSLKTIATDMKYGQATSFAVTNNLILLVNHPKCFQRKLIQERDHRRSAANDTSGKNDHTLTDEYLQSALLLLNRQPDVGSMNHSWKVRHLVKILDECRERREKALVFSQSIPTLEYLDSLLRQQGRSLLKLVGDTKINARQSMVKEFNESPDQEVFLISTGAGGVGLNITGANRVIIFDSKYNPVLDQQAIGRSYRIGQTKKVGVYRFIAGGTLEKSLNNKVVFKEQLASRVVDKENPKRYSVSDIKEMLRPVTDVPQESLQQHVGKDNIMDKMLADDTSAGGIRSIMLTDAFREEDPNDKELSAEERKEVEREYEMNRIRHSDPERYRRLLGQMGINSPSAPAPHYPGGGMPFSSTHLHSQSLPQPTQANRPHYPAQHPGPLMPTQPQYQLPSTFSGQSLAQQNAHSPMTGPSNHTLPGPSYHSAPLHVVGSGGRSMGPQMINMLEVARLYNRGQYVPYSAEMLTAVQNAQKRQTTPYNTQPPHVPQGQPQLPLAAPGATITGMQRQEAQSTSNTPSIANRVPTHATHGNRASSARPATLGGGGLPFSSPGDADAVMDRIRPAMTVFTKQVCETILKYDDPKGGAPSWSGPELKQRVEEATQKIRTFQCQRARGFLPDKGRWNDLIERAKDAVFCGLLLDGKLDFNALAWQDVNKYDPKQGFTPSPAATTASEPNRKNQDPKHLQSVLSRSKTNQHSHSPKTGSRANEDLEAMRRVDARRKQRPPKLPKWANRAVEDSQ